MISVFPDCVDALSIVPPHSILSDKLQNDVPYRHEQILGEVISCRINHHADSGDIDGAI